MKPIKCSFEVVKVKENEYDVLFFADLLVLKVFSSVYPEFFFMEKSKFGRPLIAVPSFTKLEGAEVWIKYWKDAFSNPSKACTTCPSVREVFQRLEKELSPGKP